jgi:hypothetical protein
MSSYPDLAACGMSHVQLYFHVAGGLEVIDAFWERHGLDPTRERLLFSGYSRQGRPHTIFLQWSRSHEGCSDVYVGIDARRPSAVWPGRRAKDYRLREVDFHAFIEMIRQMPVPWGIRARYAYPWGGRGLASALRRPHVRLTSISFDVLDEKQSPALSVTYEEGDDTWLTIVEPAVRFPFPEADNFFLLPYQTGCSLAEVIREEPLKTHEQARSFTLPAP